LSCSGLLTKELTRAGSRAAKASLVGANTVKGPPLETVSARPAFTTRSTRVEYPSLVSRPAKFCAETKLVVANIIANVARVFMMPIDKIPGVVISFSF